ncbi:hypothetical protein GTQ34_07925 [Muricauda sp. JGD-17]|uniref:OmpA-like domain-containing protein n=1 Tax=Flagellimonas ochracea TaxID=2696472 RepID=A0A964WX76_9FLAO|nr:hypothetical protein [Allomuricauda ochracea]NAY91841.1 hypothetical protein [Allomuricauda ochracea]
MKTQSYHLLGILATIVVGTLLYINLCSECIGSINAKVVGQEESFIKTNPPPSHSFSIADGSFSLEVKDNFRFHYSEPSFQMPIAEPLKNGVKDLKKHLDSNPDKVVHITGLYSPDETNNTNFSNLGLARANSVKNHFVMHGISSGQIQTDGKLTENMTLENNTLYGPIAFQISERHPIEN